MAQHQEVSTALEDMEIEVTGTETRAQMGRERNMSEPSRTGENLNLPATSATTEISGKHVLGRSLQSPKAEEHRPIECEGLSTAVQPDGDPMKSSDESTSTVVSNAVQPHDDSGSSSHVFNDMGLVKAVQPDDSSVNNSTDFTRSDVCSNVEPSYGSEKILNVSMDTCVSSNVQPAFVCEENSQIPATTCGERFFKCLELVSTCETGNRLWDPDDHIPWY